MKKIILAFFIFFSVISLAQEPVSPIVHEAYKKVMNSADEYKNTPVTITGQFLKVGYLTGFRKPAKLKTMLFFQCTAENTDPTQQPLQTSPSGEFFVIDKNNADLVFSLTSGDKIEMTGTTFIQNYMGTKLSLFFIVTSIKKID